MALQAEDASWQDAHYAAEAERAWAQRQAGWDAASDARARLSADVTRVRRSQIEERTRRLAAEAGADEAQVRAWRTSVADGEAAAAAAGDAQRRKAEQREADARAQLAEREAARAAAAKVREAGCSGCVRAACTAPSVAYPESCPVPGPPPVQAEAEEAQRTADAERERTERVAALLAAPTAERTRYARKRTDLW